MTPCADCGTEHPEPMRCEGCGSCLYKTAKQIPDPQWPIFECRKCGKRVFWD